VRRRTALYSQSLKRPTAIMDFLFFNDVSILSKSGIVHLCEDLKIIVGQGVWYDEYKVRNTRWLQLVSDIVMATNSDIVLCGCFGLYPSYTAVILKHMKSIHFYVVCTENPNYGLYITQCAEGKNYAISDTGNNFLITYDNENIFISFETRIVHTELPSALTLA
jgi:hypothetical protein